MEVRIPTRHRCEMVDITGEVQDAVREIGIAEGAVIVFVPHTTAGITIQENADPDVVRDMLMELEKMVPFEDGYLHAEGNSAAHIKTALFGNSVHLLVENGRLLLGTWQGVYLCEFDGPRTRRIWIKGV